MTTATAHTCTHAQKIGCVAWIKVGAQVNRNGQAPVGVSDLLTSSLVHSDVLFWRKLSTLIWNHSIFMAVPNVHGASDQLHNPVIAGAMKFRTTKVISED